MSFSLYSSTSITLNRLIAYVPSAMARSWEQIDCEADPEELEKSLVCRRLLLESGADPTAEPPDIEYAYNLFWKTIERGTEVSQVSIYVKSQLT